MHFPRNPSVRRVRLRVLGSLDLCSLQGGPAVRSAGAKRPGRQPLSTKSWAGRQPASLGGPGFERSAHIPGVGRCAAATALALSLSQCTHSQTHTHHSVHSPSLSLRGGGSLSRVGENTVIPWWSEAGGTCALPTGARVGCHRRSCAKPDSYPPHSPPHSTAQAMIMHCTAPSGAHGNLRSS